MLRAKNIYSSPRCRQAILVAITAAVLLLPIPRLLRSPATSMEEGSLVQYSTMVMNGSVPTKTFWSEYGPLNSYVPAAVFSVTGPSLLVERLVGLAYRLLLLVGLYRLLRPHSRRGAYLGVVIAWILLVPWGAMAYAWIGGLGCVLAGLSFISECIDETPSSFRDRRLLLAGLLLGLGLSFRPDMILLVAAPSAVLLWRRRRDLYRCLAGAAIGLLPLLYLVLTAGLANAFRNLVTDPVIHLRAGRGLPVPPNPHYAAEFFTRVKAYLNVVLGQQQWGGPLSLQVAELFWLLIFAAVIAVASVLGRRGIRDRRWLTVVLVNVIILTNLLQRADVSHMRLVGVVVLATTPTALAYLFRRQIQRTEVFVALSAALTAIIVLQAAPDIIGAPYANLLSVRGMFASSPYTTLTNDHRSIITNSNVETLEMKVALNLVSTHSHPGQRLFEGPTDLRFTNDNEPWFYWLSPKLVPASYYLEMNPGIANTPWSGLEREIDHADVLVLSNRFAGFSEPNASRIPGFNGPNLIVEHNFCVVGHDAWYVVLRHFSQGVTANPQLLPQHKTMVVGNHREVFCQK